MKTYYEPIYKLYVSVFVDPDQEKAQKRAERLTGDKLDLDWNSQAKTIEYTNEQGAQRIVVWLRKPEASLLAHELIHVIEYCFRVRRMPFNLDNTEFIAYYMEHLMREFEPVINIKRTK